MPSKIFKLEIDIVTGSWDIDILIDREPTPIVVETLTNKKEIKITLDNNKDYAYRYAIVAPKGTEYKLMLNGATFAVGKTNKSNTARGKGPL
jgi:hypothetical protein